MESAHDFNYYFDYLFLTMIFIATLNPALYGLTILVSTDCRYVILFSTFIVYVSKDF